MYDHLLLAFGDPGASETVVTSKEGSRRANCPILTEAGFCASFFMARCVVPQHLNKAWPSRCGWVSRGRGCCVSRRVCLRARGHVQNAPVCVRRTPATCLTHAGVLRTHTETFLTYPRGHCGVLLPFRRVVLSSHGHVVVVVVFLLESSCRHVAVVMLSSRCCDEGQHGHHVVVLNTTGNHTSLTAHTVEPQQNRAETTPEPSEPSQSHPKSHRDGSGVVRMALGWFHLKKIKNSHQIFQYGAEMFFTWC